MVNTLPPLPHRRDGKISCDQNHRQVVFDHHSDVSAPAAEINTSSSMEQKQFEEITMEMISCVVIIRC